MFVGTFCHDAQSVLTFVKEKYCRPWHVLLENDAVPRGLHVNGVPFGVSAGYDTHGRRPWTRHRIAYLQWFGCHAPLVFHSDSKHETWCGGTIRERGVCPCEFRIRREPIMLGTAQSLV